jgi:hypothetical protein
MPRPAPDQTKVAGLRHSGTLAPRSISLPPAHRPGRYTASTDSLTTIHVSQATNATSEKPSITRATAPVWFLPSRHDQPGANRTDARPRVLIVTGPALCDNDTPDFDTFARVFFPTRFDLRYCTLMG